MIFGCMLQGLDLVKLGGRGTDPDVQDGAMMPPPKMVPPLLHGASMPAPRSMGPPPPPPKFTSSRMKPEILHEDSRLKETRSAHVPGENPEPMPCSFCVHVCLSC